MGFQQALSGLNSASKSLDVIGNNIANANTTGNKMSRAEFGAMVASGGETTVAGIGVEVTAITQDFAQGNINITGNNLDVAINGSGFFRIQVDNGLNETSVAYTRDGQFQINKDGNLVTNAGNKVMGSTPDIDGSNPSATLSPIELPVDASLAPSATSTIKATFNLNAADTTVYNEDTQLPSLSKYGTSIQIYDALGSKVDFKMYFTRAATTAATDTDPALDNWDVRDASGNVLTQLRFSGDGSLYSPTTNPSVTVALVSDGVISTNSELACTLDFQDVTQYAGDFSVTSLSQDGYQKGDLTGVTINDKGLIKANFSNGQYQYCGMIKLASFKNPQGLEPIGGNSWLQSYASGEATMGQPGSGQFGTTRAGALEESNVDLTAELVNMMTTQRAYQANTQTIKTQDQVMQSLINLR